MVKATIEEPRLDQQWMMCNLDTPWPPGRSALVFPASDCW